MRPEDVLRLCREVLLPVLLAHHAVDVVRCDGGVDDPLIALSSPGADVRAIGTCPAPGGRGVKAHQPDHIVGVTELAVDCGGHCVRDCANPPLLRIAAPVDLDLRQGPLASDAVHEGLVNLWELCETLQRDRYAFIAHRPQDHLFLRIRHVLDGQLHYLRRGVREEGPGREDLAHGPVDQAPLRSRLRKRKALLLQEAPSLFLQGLPAFQADLILGLVLRAPLSRALKQWQGLPDSPELAQSEAVAKHPQQAWECPGRDLARPVEVILRIVGGRPEDGSQVLGVWSVSRLGLLVQLLKRVPGPWESTRLVVPGVRTLFQRLRIHLGEVVGPVRDVYGARSSDPAAREDADHHPAQDRELHLRVLGVQAPRGGGRPVRAFGT